MNNMIPTEENDKFMLHVTCRETETKLIEALKEAYGLLYEWKTRGDLEHTFTPKGEVAFKKIEEALQLYLDAASGKEDVG